MSRGYWLVGRDGEAIDYVEYGDEHLCDRDEDELEDRYRSEGENEIPRWAIKAGRIMWAILQPATKSAGWEAFEIVDSLAKAGHAFARRVRLGIARIAQRIQQRG